MRAMMKYKVLPFLFLVIFMASCTFESKEKNTFDPLFYAHKRVYIERSYKGCKPKTEACTYVIIDYPQFTNKDGSELLKKIDREVQKVVMYGAEATDPEAAAGKLIAEYAKFVNDPEYEGYSSAWFDLRKAEWLTIEKKVLSLKCAITNYYGGAHTNSFVALRNFIPDTGDSLGLGMVFTPENLKKLTDIGEEIFRETRNIPEGQSYDAAGYWFENGKFYLTPNFAFTGNGLLFYYNEYEIGPFSMGAVSFVIPYSRMEHLFE